LPVTDEQRSVLERLYRSQVAAHRDVQRARALLMAADGFTNTRIAKVVGVRAGDGDRAAGAFMQEGLKASAVVRPGRGRKPSIPPAKVEEIVRATLHEKPEGETHRSCRSMAAAQGCPRRRCSGSGPPEA
jgi:transposase